MTQNHLLDLGVPNLSTIWPPNCNSKILLRGPLLLRFSPRSRFSARLPRRRDSAHAPPLLRLFDGPEHGWCGVLGLRHVQGLTDRLHGLILEAEGALDSGFHEEVGGVLLDA